MSLDDDTRAGPFTRKVVHRHGCLWGGEMTEMAVQCLLGSATGNYQLILVDNG